MYAGEQEGFFCTGKARPGAVLIQQIRPVWPYTDILSLFLFVYTPGGQLTAFSSLLLPVKASFSASSAAAAAASSLCMFLTAEESSSLIRLS